MSKEMPDCPRPTGDALLKRDYWVRDRVVPGKSIKIWGRDLTYDEAWKLKQKIAGERKSTTVRVEHMQKHAREAAGMPAAIATPQDLRDQATRNAQAAARAAAREANARAQTGPSSPTMIDGLNFKSDGALLSPEQQAAEADLQDLLGGGGGGDDDLDDLIDAAQDGDSDQPRSAR